MSFSYEFPRPALTVDPVILGFDAEDGVLRVLLIKRANPPFEGHWAIPGGFVQVADSDDQGESLDDAAKRELEEETGIKVAYLEQLYTFGAPRRDPRGRVISVAYVALVRQKDYSVTAGSDAAEARWFAVSEALDGEPELDFGGLAFDHRSILKMAILRIQGKVRYTPIGFHLLPQRFTMRQLQKLYEALLLRRLDNSNFAKKVERVLVKTGIMVKTKRFQTGQHRPAPLYRFDKQAYEKALREKFNFEI
jgi:8-oxo-dGTP diphosphatase